MNAKILTTLAVLLTGATSFATTARLDALGNAVQLIDVQNVFTRPTDMHMISEQMVFEFDAVGPATAAQGGFVKNLGDSKLGFFVGRIDAVRGDAGTEKFLGVENPFTVAYGMKAGDMPWAVALTNSSSDKKTTTQKQSKTSLSGSIVFGDLTVNANLGLGDTAKGAKDGNNATTADAKYTGTSNSVGAWYVMGDWNIYGDIATGSEKIEAAAAGNTKDTTTTTKVGFVNSTKKEGTEFFYGVAYQMTNLKQEPTGAASTKTDTTTLPVLVGIEADAASWLTLRGSVTQNVLLGGTKTDAGTDSIANNTTVNAGAGLKFNKAVIDMKLSMSTAGNVQSDDIGANAALTYLF